MIEHLVPAMVDICGPDGVVTDPLDLRTYECDGLTSHRAAPEGSAYSASKAALNMYMATLAVEFGNRGVRANTVAPGWVRTEMADSEMAELGRERGVDLEGAYALATAMVPQQRPARSEEIADVIAWLLSPSASYVNGAVIPVDGGLSAVDPGMAAFH